MKNPSIDSKPETMQLQINDEVHDMPNGITIQQLVEKMGYLEKDGMAVAVNEAVIPKSQWEKQELQPDDRLTLIRATQGG